MKTSIQLKLSTGKITEIKLQEDGNYEFVIDSEEPVEFKIDELRKKQDMLALVEASKLSLKDKFMQHEPITDNERKFKDLLKKVIKRGVKDFWRPILDPSFNEDGNAICYVAGKKPAVGKSYNWWYKVAKEYNPKLRSRLGTNSEYVAFLGVLIKTLVSNDWSVKAAWNAVCNDSKELGHYWNSENALHDFGPTGSREICGFYDLANTVKIVADDEVGGFWLAGGDYSFISNSYPLADVCHSINLDVNFDDSVGWLVLEEGSSDH